MADIQAHLPDGTILAFPEGTDPSIVDATVKKHLSTPIPPTNSQGQIQSQRPEIHNNPPTPEQLDYYKNFKGTQPLSGEDVAKFLKFPAKMIPATQAAEAAASITPGGPIPKAIVGGTAGAATYFGLNKLISNLYGDDDSAGEAAKDLAINEVGGRIVGGVARGARQGLTAAQSKLSELSPTFSQYFGKSGFIPKVIEDLFAPGAKESAIKNSGAAAERIISGEAQKLSGLSKSTVDNPEFLANTIKQRNLVNALDSSFKESERQSTLARVVAKGNPTTVTTGFTPAKQFTNGVVIPGTPIQENVEGPVHLSNTIAKAQQIISESKKYTMGIPEDKKELVNEAYNIINTTAIHDDQGRLIDYRPISFNEAWEKKKAFDSLGGWNKLKNDITNVDSQFREFSHSLNEDTEASLAKWPNDPQKLGLKSWMNAKETVASRNAMFYPENSSTRLGDIIESADSPISKLNEVLDDPNKLQTALNSGNIKFPSGKVASNNMKQDMGAYNLKRIWDKSKTPDPQDPTQLSINAQGLQSAWNDPSIIEQKKQLYSAQTRSNFDQLFKNIAITQQKSLGSWIPKVTAIKAGLLLGPGLVLGSTHSLESGATTIGVELGMAGIAKLMTNPTAARIMVAAAAGQPLNMSESMAARRITSVIQGATVTLLGSDGSRQQGQLDREGKFSPAQSPQGAP